MKLESIASAVAYIVLASFVALSTAGCSGGKEVLVVYSPHGPDVLKDYEAKFEAAYPEIDVQALDMGSEVVLSRIQSEKNNPQADVWWGAPTYMFMNAADDGLLEAYRPSWASEVDAAHKDADDRWYGIYLSPIGIVYNTNELTAETAPQTWNALLEPAWNQRITIRSPLESGTMQTFIGATMLREGSDDAGIAWLERLHAATEAYMENPQLLYDHMKFNPKLVSVWLVPDIVLQNQRNGYPLETIIPPQAPPIVEGIAIVKGAPNRPWAEKFYEFVTSQEAFAHQSVAYGKLAVRKDLPDDAKPDWARSTVIDAMDVDWRAFANKKKEWMNRWQNEVFGGS